MSTIWLIQRADSKSEPLYLGVAGNYGAGVSNAVGKLDWMSHHIYAIQFCRRQDAILFIGAMRTLSNKLLHGETLVGLRSGDDVPFVSSMEVDAP